MLTIRDHGVADYAAMADMDATDVGVLTEDDWACLSELGQYLVAAAASQRFGIWLLHKHFDPDAGEIFVERTITGRRKTETAPVQRSALLESGLSTTAIRFDESRRSGVRLVGMEFAAPTDFGDTSPLNDDDEVVLVGIAERLAHYRKVERFGVRLIRNPLGLSERELFHETCDSATRTLQCTVGERDALLTDPTTVQTAWRWKLLRGTAQPTVMGQCTATCARVGEGHDIGHNHSEPDDFGND